ncbi:MAG: phosphate ABC transporter permease subunit PstC [Myxococcales bacterium]|nr:phosphate ABC transporter permease subunit PstC [Myxococcales bacterium]
MRRRVGAHARERVIELLLTACGVVSIVTTVAILGVLVFETASFFAEVSLAEFLLDTRWTPLFVDKHFGIWPLVAGTVLTSAIAIGVALPFGLLAAIYLSEFATPRARSLLKPALEVLAGVPTIVYGYFALVVLTPLLQRFIPDLAGFNALSPGIIMGIMIMPMICSLSEDAIFAVPESMREGAYALGAGKLQTVFRVVLPTAFSGIAASVILAISRAVGETMIVAIAAGQQPNLTANPRESVETMTTYMVQIGLGDTPTGTIEYKTLFVVGASLFVMTFAINLLSQRLSRRFREGR